MANLFRAGFAWLADQLERHASETVTYLRGSEFVDVPATFGRKLLRVDDGQGGFRIEWTDLDFIIPTAKLTFGGDPVIPKRGDQILVTVGTQTQTFEVFPFNGEPPWSWADPFQLTVRVRTKYIDNDGCIV